MIRQFISTTPCFYHYLVRIRGVLPIPENIQLGEKLFPEKSACASQKFEYYFQNNVSYVKQIH